MIWIRIKRWLTVPFSIVEAEEGDGDEGPADPLLPLNLLLPRLQDTVNLHKKNA